ncbi:MAG: hypothetical protein K9H64_04275 [Bacteroidales bacterium]|nr:hypothetical protein [Bacteroidales bacterium]MCF8455016.1 hypothetical protein [Bacteroidales bacterium]
MKNLIIGLLCLLNLSTYSQTNQDKAYEIGRIAINKMDSGYIEESIKLLKVAIKLDPESLRYPYEMAYAYSMNTDYKKAIKILKGLLKHPDVNDRIYQMLGNNYDYSKNPKKATETYETGLQLFPNSGCLYLERGNMELHKEEYLNALDYYEKGIEVDPQFPSNYFWATKIYLSSSEKVWGMLYGEIFINLETNSRRTFEISEFLYNTYKNEIQFISDSSISVSFSKNTAINIEDLSDPENFKLPFGIGAYEPTLMLSIIGETEINLDVLDRIRTNFVRLYFENEQHKNFPNVLFDYQKNLLESGHFEAYNHWLLLAGDEDSFSKWQETNSEKWESFVNWILENPIPIDDTHKFFTGQYI